MGDVSVWHDNENGEVWVSDGLRKAKADPLVVRGLQQEHERYVRVLEDRISDLEDENARLSHLPLALLAAIVLSDSYEELFELASVMLADEIRSEGKC